MKQIITRSVLIIFLLSPTISISQQEFSQFLPNAQAIGIGGSDVALPYDPSASYWNPANIAFLTTNRVIFNFNDKSYLNYLGLTRFFPPSLALGLNVFRTMPGDDHYDMASIALGYRIFPFLSVGTNVNFSKTMHDNIYSSMGLGLFFKTQFDYQTSLNSYDSLWKWFRSKQMQDKFSFGISVNNIALNNNEKNYDVRVGVAIKPHQFGSIIHFASHFMPDNQCSHLGALTELSKHTALFLGIQDLNMHKFYAGGAISFGAFETDISYDFKYSKIYCSLLLRLSEDKKSLFQKYREAGNQQVKENNFSGALSAYLKALAYDPGDEEINYLISALQKESNKTSLKLDSLYASGKTFEKKGWYINAFLSYRKILEIDQNNRKARRRLKDLSSVLSSYLDQIFRQGVDFYDESDLMRARLIFERILLVDRNHPGAKTYLTRIDSINANNANDYYYRGLGYYNQKNLARAKEEFRDALTYNPNHEQAKEYLEKTEKEMESNNRLIDQYMSQAKKQEENKQYARASISYRKILEIDKSNQRARNRLTYLNSYIKKEIDDKFSRAKRLYDGMDYSAAIALLQEILSIDPDYQPAKNYLRFANQKYINLAEQHFQRAQNFFNQKKWDMVLQECSLTLSMNPDHSGAKSLQRTALANIGLDKLIEKGLRYYQNSDFLNARSTFRQVLEKEPDNITARNYLDRIEAEFSERVEELFNMGMLRYTDGDYEQAINEWKKVLNVDPDHKSTKEYIQKAQERINALKKIEY